MAINPHLPTFSLPPTAQLRGRRVAQAQFSLPTEAAGKSPALTMERATQLFGESIQTLSPADRKEIQIIHSAVDEWAVTKKNPDRLGQFLVRVMVYTDERLKGLEASGGGDCRGLEAVFANGFQMVQVYAGSR